MDIEKAIKYVEMMINRKLKEIEVLIVGIAYQQGYLQGLDYKEKEEEEKEEPPMH